LAKETEKNAGKIKGSQTIKKGTKEVMKRGGGGKTSRCPKRQGGVRLEPQNSKYKKIQHGKKKSLEKGLETRTGKTMVENPLVGGCTKAEDKEPSKKKRDPRPKKKSWKASDDLGVMSHGKTATGSFSPDTTR